MSQKKSTRSAKRTGAPAAVVSGVVASAVQADARRIIPTTDWVAKINTAQLATLNQAQTLSVSHFYSGLVKLRDSFVGQIFLPPEQGVLPHQLTGTVQLPDGTPANGIAITIQPFNDANNTLVTITQTVITDLKGQFKLADLPNTPVNENTSITFHFRGANGSENQTFVVHQLLPLGILGKISLKLSLEALPEGIIASLEDVTKGLDVAEPEPPRPGTASNPITVRLGDEGCPITFNHDLPDERFRWSVLIRLVEPRTSVLTETILAGTIATGIFPWATRNLAWRDIPGVQRSFSERVPIDQPISVDGFRDRIVGNVAGIISDEENVPMAGTLGLGYIVRLAQQWTATGLSLGDLMYSLPLAPGEQQRIAVFEQRQTLSTAELETLDYDEQQRQSQISDSSTQAVFNSAFAESVRGSSSFSTQADSSSWGVAGGIGAILGPVGIGIGAAGGGGSSSSSGSSHNSLDGTRDYVSFASSNAHNAIERDAAARRHAQRTGMRLATATDVEQVTTKVVTNNNRIHALTMQYWEVLRHFDISTAVDGVTLVCFVPLEVVRFLPPGVSLVLEMAQVQVRDQILHRYSQLLKHPDVLRKWLPYQYRQGLNVLEQFAANPQAVPSFSSATEDIVHIQLFGSFLPFEEIYVEVLTRRGTRLGAVRLNGTIPALPDTISDPAHAFTSETQLLTELQRRRAPDQDIQLAADITLPSSINPDDVVGFNLTRRFRTLQYQLAPPPANDPIQQLLTNQNFTGLIPIFGLFANRLEAQVNGVTLTPDQLERRVGGPSIHGFSAATTSVPVETYAADFISPAARFPMPADGYPIAAQPVRPLLKFNELLEIEKALQHVVRNTVTYSRAVWMSLTPEERAIMLEGFTIGVPAGGVTDATQHVPLLNCVANQLLGFYGNSMIMPFNIPAEIAVRVPIEGAGEEQRPFTTAEVQNALTRFHRAGFSSPVSRIALPTQGVIGEAVLGRCPSAEKIDLTRFWNWGDSPIPQAADIAGGLLNRGTSLIGATAPSTLTGLPTMITNVNAPPADSTEALKALIAGQTTRELPDITGMQQLATLQAKTLDTAEKARADALARAQSLASQGLTSAGDIMKARTEAAKVDQADQRRRDDEAQRTRTTQLQSGVSDLRTNANQYLAVADSKPDQASADAYAQQIIQQKFGSQAVPIDTASTLFNDYRRYRSGNSGPLTQGSTAFLKALGLSS